MTKTHPSVVINPYYFKRRETIPRQKRKTYNVYQIFNISLSNEPDKPYKYDVKLYHVDELVKKRTY
jgi:hypothetical protein